MVVCKSLPPFQFVLVPPVRKNIRIFRDRSTLTLSGISTVWFMRGGSKGSKQLFIDLEKRKADADDNGQVLTTDKK